MKKRGISLIVLVITIIVVIILAGAVILSIVNNNPIENAKEAKFKSNLKTIEEELNMYIQSKYANSLGEVQNLNLIGKDLVEILPSAKDYQDKLKVVEGKLYIVKSKMSSDEITWSKEFGIEEKIANAPDISGFNKSNTYYVSWKSTDNTYQIIEENNLSKDAPSDWYDYTEGVNHWANIKTTGGENDCYWVWIPRYAYCITGGYHSNVSGEVDIKFLKGTTNTPLDGSSITISNSSGEGNWNVHPAFWWDKNNNGVEDEGEQLSGIWVAKFEASSNSASVVENPTSTQLETDGGSDTDTDLKIRVKPNVTSWRNITVNSIFTVCRNLTTIGNSLESTSNLDSHMMKNTEWGAMAYLSRSIYGKNKEVWNNPYYNNTTNCSPITGLCGNELNSHSATTDISKTYKYNEKGGENASTTGNVYGVYDMAGGSWEYVAGIFASGASNDNQSQLFDFKNLKYVDKYTNKNGSQPTYYGNNKYGDAVYETSASGIGRTDSWGSSFSQFPYSSSSVFIRGGSVSNGSSAGVFAFLNSSGETATAFGFRPVVISSY